MLEEIIKILSFMLLSAFKLVVAVPVTLAVGNYRYLEAVLITSVGGIAGVALFTLFSEWIIGVWKKYRRHPPTRRRWVNPVSRFIIRVKRGHGLLGMAIISPVILTIPVGSFVMVRYFRDRKKIILYESAAVIFWSLLIATLRYLFPGVFGPLS